MKDTTLLNTTDNFNPFSGPVIERVIYTTQPQAEIWIACKLGDKDANRAYNESISLILTGGLNKSALENAIQSLVDRHEALRAVFSTDGKFMSIFKQLSLTVDYHDVSKSNDVEKDKFIKGYLSSEANYIFDLLKGPLLKVGLIKKSETEHHLILTGHHIVCDGWSLGIMLQELGSLYSSNVNNTAHNLPKPESFSAYADEQHKYLASNAHTINENYWLNQFQDAVPQLTLPTDFPRPQFRTFKSERLDLPMPMDLVDALKKTGVKAGSSFVTTLLSTFEIFLYTQTEQGNIVLGLPSADQAASDKTQMIGHCVNLLPLRSKIDSNISFSNYLKQRKFQLFDAYEHQKFSFGELLQKLSIARDPSRVPLVPVVFNIDMGMDNDVSFSGLDYVLKSNPRAYEIFELFLNASGSEKELVLEWSYNSNLFKSETIQNMMTSFQDIIATVVDNPDIKIGDIVKVDDSQYNTLNSTKVDYPQSTLHQLISRQAQASPEKQALKYGESEISYHDLEKQVNQLAHRLKEEGINPGHVVAVALPRSIELVVSLLAIMQCGAAYLPLDPSYPQQRLDFMIEDSQAEVLISSNEFTLSSESIPKILMLEDLFLGLSKYSLSPLNISIALDDMVYLLYTSGSTGKPKGVQVTHKNLVNFLYGMLKEPGIEEADRLLSITTISFDIAGLELFLPLLKGATLVVARDEVAKDPRLMLDVLKEERITMLQATPTTWQMLLDAGWQNRLPLKALCGGEALPLSLATKLFKRVDEVWNMYGPTETTIWSAVKQIMPDDELITIGHPIANTQLYILDENGALVVPGKIGELCIAGDGVAKGYWKRPDLTAEKFLKNTFNIDENAFIYRTGDLGKLLPTGEIQCLGRIDQQVKIRGHRIELGEIEEAINTIDGIESSVVIIDEDRLKTFVITNNLKNATQVLEQNWKAYLKERLPLYMVPQEMITLDKFPTTLNGKIDRKSLITSASINSQKAILTFAQSNSEQLVATIWQESLGIDKIDVDSNFFELGGHSLIAVKVMTRLEKETGNRLPLAALLEQPTIKKLAAYLDKKYITWDSLVPLKTNGHKIPIFIVHGANHNVLVFKNLSEILGGKHPIYALQAKGLSGDIEPHDSVEAMAAHYISEIKTINPDGPYAIGGFSFGGIVAFEMAKQLKAEGKEVKNLALFDSYAYPHYSYSNPAVKRTIARLYNMGQLFFMLFNMFSSVKNFKRRVELLKISFSGLYLRLKYGREKQYQLQFNRTSKIDEMHAVAFLRYNLIPQDIQVDLFRSTEDIYFTHDYKNLGWKKIAKGGIRKHMIPGNHSEMFLPPAVDEVSELLESVLSDGE
ncbi:non-ribosomal peptide synthetase [Winogradskyella thalassocola]|uniref:Amino acid adenylation domain-containing protein n=1 Tax=Winogradskyella thalassocola TaxID=262004 RepID=A0A1G8LCI5_9FLAO|nr:non-ribosomal peptide synthetase [Winogradskyella thalassocola]SDI53412.1 amino acid adenylation domain-containing protein [Winogradskyella thalassocola]